MTIAPPLVVRPLTEPDTDSVLSLLSTALAGGPTGQRTSDFFIWKHVTNPFGRSAGLVAESDGELVGVRLLMHWQFLLDGETVDAVRPVDTATAPGHQGRGIFKRLTLQALAELGPDVRLVFNTPNDNSRPGYLSMGWSPVGTLPVALRPLHPLRLARHARAARGAPGGSTRLPDCPLPDVEHAIGGDWTTVERLLETIGAPPGRLVTRRSTGFLRWRYAEAPGLDYRAVAVHADDRLVGLAIGRPRWRGPLTEFVLSELLVRPGDRSTERRLLRGVAGSGCDYVAGLPSAPPHRRGLRRAGYVTVPRTGITLVVNPRGQQLAVDTQSPDSWCLSLGDLEVF